MTLREKIGQKLVTGFPGTEMTEDFRRMVREYKVANFILFKENVTDRAQFKQLCADIDALVRKETGHGAFITIDQEGGIVSRLPDDAANVPGAMAMAAMGNPHAAYDAGLLTGRALRALGANFDLAPCVDVNSNAKDPVIGVRSYGDKPAAVSEYSVEMIHGLMDGGVLCSAKHFPGHGDTSTDSHLTLPCVDKSYDELMQCELLPFMAAIEAGVPAVMTTHILFPQLEAEKIPATMSRTIMTDILRGKLGFDGLVISDCMEMNAIKEFYGTVNGVVAAAKAGVDLIFISHSTALCAEAVERIEDGIANGSISETEITESAERIVRYKTQWLDEKQVDASFDFDKAEQITNALIQKSVTEVQIPLEGRVQAGNNPICIGCPIYRTALIGNVINENDNIFGQNMVSVLGGQAKCMSINPEAAEIAALVQEAQGHTCAIVGTYNGHLRPGQLELISALCKASVPVIAVAMRNPYDLADLPKSVYALEVYEYTKRSIYAAARVIAGEEQATAHLPVKL